MDRKLKTSKLSLLVLTGLLTLAGLVAFRCAGRWLVLDDPLVEGQTLFSYLVEACLIASRKPPRFMPWATRRRCG